MLVIYNQRWICTSGEEGGWVWLRLKVESIFSCFMFRISLCVATDFFFHSADLLILWQRQISFRWLIGLFAFNSSSICLLFECLKLSRQILLSSEKKIAQHRSRAAVKWDGEVEKKQVQTFASDDDIFIFSLFSSAQHSDKEVETQKQSEWKKRRNMIREKRGTRNQMDSGRRALFKLVFCTNH